MINIDSIPEEMRVEKRWAVSRDGVPTKPGSNRPASATTKADWGHLDDCLADIEAGHGDGVAFTFHDSKWVGIDRDDCLIPGQERSAAILAEVVRMDTYTEVSKSGTGIHMIVEAEISHNGVGPIPDLGKLEIKRGWMNFTGTVFAKTLPPVPQGRQVELEALIEKAGITDWENREPWPDPENELSDQQVVDKAIELGGTEFRNLLTSSSNVVGGSPSEDDWGLARHLIRAGASRQQILRLFEQSPRYRPEKGERYYVRTIENAFKAFEPIPKFTISFVKVDKSDGPPPVLSYSNLMSMDIPEPEYVVPHILPVGLHIIAGKSKLGKSLMMLTLAKAITGGGQFLGQKVQTGRALYLSLDDPDWRMKKRLRKQGWSDENAGIDFVFIADYWEHYGDLANEGSQHLLEIIEAKDYLLVVVDTLGRATRLQRNEYETTTFGLTPIQEIARSKRIVVTLIDHHNKQRPDETDALLDIGGSVAKGAMLDSAWGFYKTGGGGNRLDVIGKDIIDRSLHMKLNTRTLLWESTGEEGSLTMTDRRSEIVLFVRESKGLVTIQQIVDAVGQDYSNTSKRVGDLVADGQLQAVDKNGTVLYGLPVKMPVVFTNIR